MSDSGDVELLPSHSGVGCASGWHIRAVCPECGWSVICPFDEMFHVHYECCPDCGASKGVFRKVVVRWRSGVVWWKPWTWGKGAWERLRGGRT
jgi:hypothetical protein